MPTYEYLCKKCAHNFEIVQSFSDDPLTKCPECKGALRKVFGNVGITFKGSGFYKTDSKGSSSSTTTGGTKTEGKSESASSTSTSSDSGSSSSGSSDSSSSSSHGHSHGPGSHTH
jgi:putative FmdB family regulatory protein